MLIQTLKLQLTCRNVEPDIWKALANFVGGGFVSFSLPLDVKKAQANQDLYVIVHH